jgi:hypothetical protein
MSDVGTAVVTSFVSAFTTFLALAAFISHQTRDVKSEVKSDIDGLRTELKSDIGRLDGKIDGLRTEVKADISRLDEKFERLMFELLRHFREGGHPPPPQAA